MEELRRQAGWAKTFGLPLELISAEEARELFPLMSTEGWWARRGFRARRLSRPLPAHLRARGRRAPGRYPGRDVHRVTGIEVERGRVRGVRTEQGDVSCEVAVIAAGMFSAEVGRLTGVRIPVVPMSHQYLVAQPFRRDPKRPLPTLRDPDLLVYFREEGGGLVMGGYERQSDPAFLADGPDRFERIPPDFNGRLLEDDWDRFEEIVAGSRRRVPDGGRAGHTAHERAGGIHPGQRILPRRDGGGRAVRGGRILRARAGGGGWRRQGHGRLDRGRRARPRPLAHGYPPLRVALPIALVHVEADPRDLRDLLRHRLPGARARGRPPASHLAGDAWHQEHRAAFGEKSGWERVNWYEANAAAGDESLRPRGWAGRHWSPAIGAEHVACRERVAIFDESSFAKLEIAGPGAAELVERLCDNRVAREVASITYTQVLNRRGGIECDFTVGRLDEDRYSIVTGTAFGNHDREWIRRNAAGANGVQIRDVTSQWACLGIWGPRARDLLSPLTPQALSNEEFPYPDAARDDLWPACRCRRFG